MTADPPVPAAEPAAAAKTDSGATDRFEWWPAMVFVLPFAFGVGFGLPGLWGLLSTACLFGIPLGLVVILVSIYESARQRRWRRTISRALFLPLLVAGSILLPSIFFEPFYMMGLWVRFIPVYGLYEEQVAALPARKHPLQFSSDLGYFGFWAFVIIYDETGRVADELGTDLNPDQLSTWIDSKAARQCWGHSNHLIGHYYACVYAMES